MVKTASSRRKVDEGHPRALWMGSEAQSFERQLSSEVNRSEGRMRKGKASKPEADVASTSRSREGA